MKKLLVVLGIILSYDSFSQALTIEETLEYINDYANSNRFWNWEGAYIHYKIEISNNGYFIIYKCFSETENGEAKKQQPLVKFHYDDLDITKTRIYVRDTDSSNSGIFFDCKDSENCVKEEDRPSSYAIFPTKNADSYDQKRVLNAFRYLLSLLQNSNQYKRDDLDDPFSPSIQKQIAGNANSGSLPIVLENGNYSVLAYIGALKQRFIIDSGASETSITSELERLLINNGTLGKEDYLALGLYKLADGSIIQSRRVRIRQFRLGGFTLNNVVASVGNDNSPLLLGANILSKFKSWAIDNNSMKLILEK